MKETEPYLEKFERFEKEAKQPSWLFPLRKAGIAQFAEQGFPTINDEDWRFTNVAPITKLPFNPVFEGGQDGISAKTVEQLSFGQLPAHRLVFVNGIYAPDLSSPSSPNGVVISNLAGALKNHAGLVEKHLERYSKDDDNSFAALNTAFFQDGGFVYVPAGRAIEKPVHLLYISTAKDSGTTSHPRN